VRGEAGLLQHDPGGLEITPRSRGIDAALRKENHTLKRR